MELKSTQTSNLFNVIRVASLSAFAACSTFTLLQPTSANAQSGSEGQQRISPSGDARQIRSNTGNTSGPQLDRSTPNVNNTTNSGDLNQQNNLNPIDSENPASLRQNPATLRQDSTQNDRLTTPNSNFPGRGSYTAPRTTTTPGSSQESLTPSNQTGGNADSGIGGSRLTSPNTGGSGTGPDSNINMRRESNTNSTTGNTGVGGSTDSGIGESRFTSSNTGGSGSGSNPNLGVDNTINSPTGESVDSITNQNGTLNNSGGSSNNTSGAVQGLW
jgi:hypothetical protein